MADWKSMALLAAVALAGMNAKGDDAMAGRVVLNAPPGGAMATSRPTVDAHRPVTYRFAVTNTTDKPQTIESVRTSCACLMVKAATSAALPPQGVLPFDVEFNPAGMEGHVEKRVWVTLAPSKKIETFDVAADVRLRLGFKPMDAAFGVIRRSDTGREIVAKLSGYAAEGVKLGTPCVSTLMEDLATKNTKDTKNLRASAPLSEKNDTVFDARLAPDGKGIVVKFRERNVLPGIYSEVWTIPTSDKEIPEIKFPVSARVADMVSQACAGD